MRLPRKSGRRLASTHNRPGRSARAQTVAERAVASPLCTPWVRAGRPLGRYANAGALPNAPTTPPASPACSRVRLLNEVMTPV
ncbi:hypothetical protein GCM10009616_40090 [Microlunatus lacustris]